VASLYCVPVLFFPDTLYQKEYEILELKKNTYTAFFDKNLNIVDSILAHYYTFYDGTDTLHQSGTDFNYRITGILLSKTEYTTDVQRHKLRTITNYDELGQISSILHLKDEKADGEFLYYDPSGSLEMKEIYSNGKLKQGKSYASGVETEINYREDKIGRKNLLFPAANYSLKNPPGAPLPTRPLKETYTNSSPVKEGSVFTVVEIPATFPGGEQAMGDFIRKNIKYSKQEKKGGISGVCYVTFIVEQDGTVSNVKLLKGIPYKPKCNEEAIRVVKKMPKWKPGFQNGKAVRVQFNLPIRFTSRP